MDYRKKFFVDSSPKIRFAPDSTLEGSGFELPVPRRIGNDFAALSETRPSARGARRCRRAFARRRQRDRFARKFAEAPPHRRMSLARRIAAATVEVFEQR
jgi:hypothetical protein